MNTNTNQNKRIRIAEAARLLGCSVKTVRANRFGFKMFKMNPDFPNSPLLVDAAEVRAYRERQAIRN